jgi:tRNA threonylcarbamoyladenosine modification (KEOPS) complex  Pcc1 subunit
VSASARKLELRIEADDLVALRAASNSFLHFTAVALKAIEAVAPFNRSRTRVLKENA